MPGKVKRSLLLDRGSDERFGARRQAAFSNINFSSLFYQRPILVAKGKTIDYACKRKRRYDGRARVILLCNIDMPTISYFPSCYVDRRGITGRIGDFPVNWFLSRDPDLSNELKIFLMVFIILIRMLEQRIDRSLWQEFSIGILFLINQK